MNPHSTALFHVYGYRHSDRENRCTPDRYFIVSSDSLETAIAEAQFEAQYDRVEVHDVRENRIVWRKP